MVNVDELGQKAVELAKDFDESFLELGRRLARSRRSAVSPISANLRRCRNRHPQGVLSRQHLRKDRRPAYSDQAAEGDRLDEADAIYRT